MTKDFSTEGFALAMFEEFILCILICLATSWSNHPAVWGLWLGVFIACAIHFVVHILQAILLKTYIPALLTSLICLPPSIWIGTKVLQHFSSQLAAMAPTILLGGILTVANLLFAQRLIGVATRWLNHY